MCCRPYSAGVLHSVSDKIQNLKNCFTNQIKMTSKDDIWGLVSLKFLRPCFGLSVACMSLSLPPPFSLLLFSPFLPPSILILLYYPLCLHPLHLFVPLIFTLPSTLPPSHSFFHSLPLLFFVYFSSLRIYIHPPTFYD